MSYQIHLGSNLDVLPTLPDNSVDSIVTDPPYELGFMGKSWDSSGIAYSTELWSKCLRVLKPGGHLLAFGGSRTWHRIAVSIEDSGFQVRDSIAWLSNKTFPKSIDISKAIDKRRNDGKAIAAVARRMRELLQISKKSKSELDKIFGTKNVAQYWFSPDRNAQIVPAERWLIVRDWLGAGNELDAEVWRLNGRKGQPGEAWAEREVIGQKKVPEGHAFASEKFGKSTNSKEVNETLAATQEAQQWEGWGTALKPVFEPIVVARKPLIGTVAENVLTHGTGGLNIAATRVNDRWPSNVAMSNDMAQNLEESVYFFVPKATKRDRSEGLETENFHPTVKPTDLMRYLIKLVTPPGGVVLDPFTGSGSTGKAAILEGFDFIGIELTEEYLPIIEGRLAHAEKMRAEAEAKKDEGLF